MDLLKDIREKASKLNRRIVFPESDDERILKACEQIAKEKIATPILIGSKGGIESKSKELGIDLAGVAICDPSDFPDYEKYASSLFELRKHKGMTLEEAHKILQEPIYLGTMMVRLGEADGLVSGACHPTAHTLRPALQIIKTTKDVYLASSYFFMVKDEDVLLFADCGFVIDPDEHQLAEIAMCTAYSARQFGIEPRVAMLSFSTKGSAEHAHVDKVAHATRLVQEKMPELIVDGELQFDAAYVESVALKKCPDSPLKGHANIFIFPCLDAGNIAYKIAQRLGKYEAIGPIVQGLNKPINDLSRGCSVDDIINIAAITAVEAKFI